MKALKEKPAYKKPRPSSTTIPVDKNFTDHPEGHEILTRSAKTALIDRLMQLKKSRAEKRKREKVLFLSIGLCISILLVIGAFELKTYSGESTISMESSADRFETLVDVPHTAQPAPPTPRVEQLQIIEVPDEEVIEQEMKINLDVEITEEAVIEEVTVTIPTQVEEEEKAEEIFTIVEQQPSPVGGMAAFYKYVGDNLTYPSLATRMNIQGRVFVQFVIEKDGSITDVKVIKGIGGGCDEEALRVVSQAPKWEPGKQRGRPVRVRMILPIVFKLIE